MKRAITLKVAAAVLVFASVVPTAQAQTGPTGPTTPAPAPVNGGIVQTNKMTPARLVALLQQDGHKVDIKKFNNGAQTVIANVKKDGWQFQVEFEFDAPGKNMNVLCPLGNGATKFSAEQLLALLKKSYELPSPVHFSYRASDQKLCLEDPTYSTNNMTDASLRSILDRLVRTVRDTHPLWDTSRWPVNG